MQTSHESRKLPGERIRGQRDTQQKEAAMPPPRMSMRLIPNKTVFTAVQEAANQTIADS